jgi:hypothetical protein
VRFIRTLVLGSGFVASLYTKDAQQHVPTIGNRTFVGEWQGDIASWSDKDRHFQIHPADPQW